MPMQELLPGFWRWTAPHPDWKPSPPDSPGAWGQYVSCLRHESPNPEEPVVLIDPLVPPEAEELWRILDERIAKTGHPLAILVSNPWHHRSAPALYQRYRERSAAAVWAHSGAMPHLKEVGCPVTGVFRGGDPLPGGWQAHEIEGLHGGEVALYEPGHRVLVLADALLGRPDGRLRVPPRSWAPNPSVYEKLRPSLERLLELPVEHVVVSHGEPVLSNGQAALREALASPAWDQDR